MSLIPTLTIARADDAKRVESLLTALRLDPVDLALLRGERGKWSTDVQAILADVAQRGDDAIVDVSRKFDDPKFSADQIRVTQEEMRQAASRVPATQLSAIRHSIKRVREYQQHIMP